MSPLSREILALKAGRRYAVSIKLENAQDGSEKLANFGFLRREERNVVHLCILSHRFYRFHRIISKLSIFCFFYYTAKQLTLACL